MRTQSIASLDEFFVDELSSILVAERSFLDGQRAMLGRATAPALRAMIEAHIAESEGQVEALGQAFEALDAKPRRAKCDAAEGLVAGAERAMKRAGEGPHVLDCAIASTIAKVEHFEVGCYRGLVAAAKGMERDDLLEILLGNLEQEEEAAAKVEAAMPDLLRRAMNEVIES